MAIFFCILPGLFFLRTIGIGYTMLLGSLMLPVFGLLALPVIEWGLDGIQSIKDARPDSTRVRSALAEIAVQRWADEAPIWGHGIVERGPKVVEHMPIGTHHSWYGLLFTKGITGAIALAVPMLMTLTYLFFMIFRYGSGFAAMLLVLVIGLYSFFENLEILVYLYWPALIYIGHAINPEKILVADEEENTLPIICNVGVAQRLQSSY